jgi:glycosyltransferase involved in cell wall biosynthesis
MKLRIFNLVFIILSMAFNGKKVSVVIPAYNEEKAISKTVKEFSLPFVDEIVVVDNASTDRTATFAKRAGARVVEEHRKGYGFSCRKALASAKGDIIVLVEADGTFDPKDTKKLLSYIGDADMVLGTRTYMQFVEEGANMGVFLGYGNLFVAKLLQVLYGDVRLTDVGCTFRAIKKGSLKKVAKRFKVGGSTFSPEMIIEALKAGLKIVEIPIHYRKRIGTGTITHGSNIKAFVLGLKMIWLVLSRKFS